MDKPLSFAGDRNFDRFEIGEVFLSPARTITETDTVHFAYMTGAWHPLFSDALAASKSEFGERIVSGVLTFAIMNGLMYRAGVVSQHSIGFLGLRDWSFRAPVYIGDTLQARFEVKEKRASKSKVDRGVITFFIQMLNLSRGGEVHSEGHWMNMFSRVNPPL